MNATVRLLDTEDWPRYRTVRLAALAESPSAFGSTLAREEAFGPDVWRDRLAARNTYLAEADGRPCGTVAVIRSGPGAAEIVGMWVSPAARGSGAADLLVQAALGWAADHGLPQVHLWVAEGNPRAERLYARHGFQRTGALQPMRPGSEEKQFEMSRPAPA